MCKIVFIIVLNYSMAIIIICNDYYQIYCNLYKVYVLKIAYFLLNIIKKTCQVRLLILFYVKPVPFVSEWYSITIFINCFILIIFYLSIVS